MTRLQAICLSVVPAKVIADVGCDHGKVGEYVVTRSLCEKLIASDVSGRCLDKARKRLSEYKNVCFAECDGIDYDCDEAIIAGMGGLSICAILDGARTLPKIAVLCPHRDEYAVRKKLCELHYEIDRDFMVTERGKTYFVIRGVKRDGVMSLDEAQMLFGKFYKSGGAELISYLKARRKIYEKCPEKNKMQISAIDGALADVAATTLDRE